MITSANEIKFRCSSISYIMGDNGLTEKQAVTLADLRKKESLTDAQKKTFDELVKKESDKSITETAKTHCIDAWVSAMYSRREEFASKYLEKGNAREEDAITLLSRITKTFYKKNTKRLSNEFISGEADLFLGKTIETATETNDTKCSWSAHTFFRVQKETLNPIYKWQGTGYLALTGAKKHTVSYCLVNATAKIITDEKKKLAFQEGMMDGFGNESEAYIEKCRQLEINHIFDMESFLKENPHYEFHIPISEWKYDIPMEKRLFQISFERNEADINRIYEQVSKCRAWIQENLMK